MSKREFFLPDGLPSRASLLLFLQQPDSLQTETEDWQFPDEDWHTGSADFGLTSLCNHVSQFLIIDIDIIIYLIDSVSLKNPDRYTK